MEAKLQSYNALSYADTSKCSIAKAEIIVLRIGIALVQLNGSIALVLPMRNIRSGELFHSSGVQLIHS